MTRDDIIRMAREAGWNWPEVHTTSIDDRLERFAALVAAAEREACACDVEQYGGAWDGTTSNFARLIRERSKE